MKKKLIESMPLPCLPKGATGFVAIARRPEKGLVVIDYIDADVNLLVLRIGLRKWEYMNYIPGRGIWNQVNIRDIKHHLDIVPGDPDYTKIISGKSHLEKLFKKTNVGSIENMINWTIQSDRERARANRVEARNNKVPELTEQEESWLYTYVGPMHWAYYRRRKRKVDISCTACGKNGTFYINKYDLSLEEYTQSVDAPEHNMYGDCPICGSRVQFKAAGLVKGVYEKKDYRYIISRYDDADIVLRYFEVYKRFVGDEKSANESVRHEEIARTFYTDKKVHCDYHKYSPYTGQTFWDDRNLASMANIIKHSGKTYQGNLDLLKDTRFRYACIDKQLQRSDYSDMEAYISAYQKYPFIEMLQKLGMSNMVNYVIDYYYSTKLFDRDAKGGPGIFRITKERFNRMREENLGVECLRLFQMEKKKEIRFSDKDINAYIEMELSAEQAVRMMTYSSFEKVSNYLHKQLDRDAGQICSHSNTALRSKVRKYADYLILCEGNGRDMSNPHKIYPVDLDEAHDREVLYKSREELKEKKKQKNKDNPNIKKDAAGYNSKYMYQNEDYIIRAPKNAGEIYAEGLLLDHCVGRAGYIESMNRHETLILFLRKKNKPNIPYYTLEIQGGKIRQAYGKCDKKPDWDEVEPFLNAFTKAKLKKKRERMVG